jgi:TctA family transporter
MNALTEPMKASVPRGRRRTCRTPLVGVLLGTAIGVLPGIGPAMTGALLLPITYALPAISAFIMFAGPYYGGMYGGSTTSAMKASAMTAKKSGATR